ncbi:MAG: DKNYY domain-containing protein [Bacteroidetes bacterium]|nr:DKNYY domain-containing protein [Bacteroidota bacterium]
MADTKPVLRTVGANGNKIINWQPFCSGTNEKCGAYIDPVDDTTTYKLISGKIYSDTAQKVFVLSIYQDPKSLGRDTTLFVEYFQDVTDQIDLRSYKVITDGYFTTNGKVYLWWGDMQHSYPVEVNGADPGTFMPFDSIAGGIDSRHVFYGGPPGDLEIIPGADPHSIKILNPKGGCWNCGNCYFADRSSVFFGLKKIKDADPKTFRLVNEDQIDAEDKNHRYFDGKPVK